MPHPPAAQPGHDRLAHPLRRLLLGCALLLVASLPAQPPVFVVLAGQQEEGEGLLDVRLDPSAQLGVLLRPALQPAGQVGARFQHRVSFIKPGQLGDAVVGVAAAELVTGVAQEVDVAALPAGFGEDFHDGALEAGMIVADDHLHPVQPAFLQAEQLGLPRARALLGGQLHRQDLAAAVPADAQGDLHGPALAQAVLPHPFVTGVATSGNHPTRAG
jgi:hypothetical protein